MKKLNKKFIGRLSQTGSLMIEAMAMLGLIALVTPTLYKKSAERTTELQDINTATHLRTMIKAVDNYVAANYNELLDTMGNDSYQEVALNDLNDYLPYGYAIDGDDLLKNFGAPKVSIHKNTNSITSYVELPKKLEIGAMRAARIASMVGSNGGFVNKDGNAEGVGGIWSLEKNKLTDLLKFSGAQNSIVAASSEAITSASSSALENDKYLQRTKVESEDQKWRNTMATDLYLGGVANNGSGNTSDLHSIYGVDQLIIGATENNTGFDADLVVLDQSGAYDGVGGSAFFDGSLRALSDLFSVSLPGGADNGPRLRLWDTQSDDRHIFEVNRNNFTVYERDDGELGLWIHNDPDINNSYLNTSFDTTIDATLTSTDNTYLATGNDSDVADVEFKVGPMGRYITATRDNLSLRNGQIQLSGGMESENYITDVNGSAMNIKTHQVNITDSASPNRNPEKHAGLDPKLYIQGNTYADGILYTKELEAEKFDTLELHAGGEDFNNKDNRRLHATADKVWIKDQADLTRFEVNPTDTIIRSADSDDVGGSHIKMGGTAMDIYNMDQVTINTLTGGAVQIQDDVLNVYGRGRDSRNETKGEVEVNDSFFRVGNASSPLFEVNPVHRNSRGSFESASVESNVHNFIINTTHSYDGRLSDASFEVQDLNSNKILNVKPHGDVSATRNSDMFDSAVYVDPDILSVNENLTVNDLERKRILEVDTNRSGRNTAAAAEEKGSVYVRNGAVEIRQNKENTEIPDLGENYGYIDSDRFITTEQPVFSGEYGDNSNQYDRYMINPAYTSVMHDIKLTTRGGARLSDILPDFINKGIYVVNNTMQEKSIDFSSFSTSGWNDIGTSYTGTNAWASPYLGTVPTPQCPPGYAKVITLTPAGFMMSPAGMLSKVERADGAGFKYAVTESESLESFGKMDDSSLSSEGRILPNLTHFTDSTNTNYYLGYTIADGLPTERGSSTKITPQPLYFQQSNWLRSKVLTVCGNNPNSATACGDDKSNFVGWATFMGFIYPEKRYPKVIEKLSGATGKDGAYYWNIFPVLAQTLEGYATVYCYFDRTNMYPDSKNNAKYTDQYDQLNAFRSGSEKADNYLDRLEDPNLNYNEPW